jgi:hypothetical protein
MAPHTLESEGADFHRLSVGVGVGVGVGMVVEGFRMELAVEAMVVGANGS